MPPQKQWPSELQDLIRQTEVLSDFLCGRRRLQKEDRDDILQEALFALHVHFDPNYVRDKGLPESYWKYWTIRVIKNKINNLTHPLKHKFFKQMPEEFSANDLPNTNSLYTSALAREEIEAIEAARMKLTYRQRKIIRLQKSGKTIPEIAVIVLCSASVVSREIRKAKTIVSDYFDFI